MIRCESVLGRLDVQSVESLSTRKLKLVVSSTVRLGGTTDYFRVSYRVGNETN